MRFTILEIFFIFWISAFLWILVEYVHQRISKRDKRNLELNSLKKDRSSDSFAA
jgi:hypothetical protein